MGTYKSITNPDLLQYAREGVKKVEILGCGDSCPSCKKFDGKKYRIAEAPELPNPNCIHPKGCRCCYSPIVEI
jgi:hypothetical protein